MKCFEEVIARYADAQVGDRRVQGLRIIRDGLVECDGIGGIVASQDLQERGGVSTVRVMGPMVSSE